MIGLLTFLDVLFTGLLTSKAIASVGKTVGAAALGVEVYLHRDNAETGRNPFVDNARRNLDRSDDRQGILVIPDLGADVFELFKISKDDIQTPDSERWSGTWLLTRAEMEHVFDILGRDLYHRMRNREGAELGRLRVVSDNRLSKKRFTNSIIHSLGDDAEGILHLNEAIAEALARKNKFA